MASKIFWPIHFSNFTDKTNSKTPLLISSLFIFLVLFAAFLLVYFLRICAHRRCGGAGGISDSPPSAAVAVDPATVSFLPVSSHGSAVKKPSHGADCAICLGSLQEGEKVKVLPLCRHRFHSGCLAEWLVTRSSCPLCRGCVHPVHSLSHELDSVMWMTS